MTEFLLEINRNAGPDEKKYNIHFDPLDKFQKDKIFYENDLYLLLLDGVILNKYELLDEKSAWKDVIIELYQSNGIDFFSILKGSFFGVLYDKRRERWVIFNDHISTKPLFYSKLGNKIYFSNNYTFLLNHLRYKGRTVTLDEQAAYLLLTYGYVIEKFTLCKEIRRLLIGHYAIISGDKLSTEKFYQLTNIPEEISVSEAIEELDAKFKNAVGLGFKKDLEYGYKHFSGLSGGLDSRMTVWIAHHIGFKNQLNFTFSQSDYLDETIPKQIASDLKHEWIFKSLDNGSFLNEIEETVRIFGGNSLYYSLAHGNSLYKYLNFSELGIAHTGQLGDVVLSSFSDSVDSKSYTFGDGAYSRKLLQKLDGFSLMEDYQNQEIFKMYIRGFYGANSGLLGIQKYTETYSPFYDIDLMEFAWKIPRPIRFNHNLYKKFILEKYPEAGKYVWEREKVPLDYKFWIPVGERKLPLKRIPKKILSKWVKFRSHTDTKYHMNPLDYWYRTNLDLKKSMDAYFNENINNLHKFPELLKDAQQLYLGGTVLEKTQVLTLLAAQKIYFS